MKNSVTFLLVATAASVGLSVCAESHPTVDVVVKNVSFDPAELSITTGTEVAWYFEDEGIFHDVVIERTDVTPGFRNEGNYKYTFDEPGTYTVTCSIHPQMVGTIMVDDP